MVWSLFFSCTESAAVEPLLTQLQPGNWDSAIRDRTIICSQEAQIGVSGCCQGTR